jgi:hypothetical protein
MVVPDPPIIRHQSNADLVLRRSSVVYNPAGTR